MREWSRIGLVVLCLVFAAPIDQTIANQSPRARLNLPFPVFAHVPTLRRSTPELHTAFLVQSKLVGPCGR
jgi:hypothetical protein